MSFRVLKVELENFRGARPAVQILTLSCTYVELLQRCPSARGGVVSVRISQPGCFETAAVIAMVHPISAPAMLSVPLARGPVEVGSHLDIIQNTI